MCTSLSRSIYIYIYMYTYILHTTYDILYTIYYIIYTKCKLYTACYMPYAAYSLFLFERDPI